MRVLHVVPSIAKKFGGPGWSVTALCDALARLGVDVSLITLDLTGDGPDSAVRSGDSVRVSFVKGWHFERIGIVVSPSFKRCLRNLALERDVQVIHDHGLWLQTNRDSSLVAQQMGLPLVSAPRGTLEPWPRNQKKAKKTLAWHLYQRRALKRASLLHATSRSEAEGFRSMGLNQPIAVLPNGIDWNDDFRRPPDQESQGRIAVFLSRIHPKKGIQNLIEAWAEVRPTGWKLCIVGPDEAGHRAEIERRTKELDLERAIEISGPVYGDAKRQLLARAEIFVLPTLSENFGIVIAESLAAGTPVITTREAPWRDLERHGCGWWIDVGVEPLIRALTVATRCSPKELKEMGLRGQKLIEQSYTWGGVAERTLRVYRWLLGEGPRPECLLSSDSSRSAGSDA